MTLDQVEKGAELQIVRIPNDSSRSQLVRMGIAEGSTVICHEKMPLGPVILRCRRQEIAIGRSLARTILVRQ